MKFKDADLIGIPLRITIGGRGLKNGIVELKWRDQEEKQEIAVSEAAAAVVSLVEEKSKG